MKSDYKNELFYFYKNTTLLKTDFSIAFSSEIISFMSAFFCPKVKLANGLKHKKAGFSPSKNRNIPC